MSSIKSSEGEVKTPQSIKPLEFPLELRCGACGRKGSYWVGRLFIDPARTKKDGAWLNDAFGFTNYVHCQHCHAGGPWDLTQSSMTAVLALMEESLASPEAARIHSAEVRLFDGTTMRWATEGEAHLKKLIEKDPDNFYLWSRLGNVYISAEAKELGLEAFREAVKRNEKDVESLHSIAMILQERHENEAAAHYYHEVLRHARHAPEVTSRSLLRNMIAHTLESVSELHVKSGGKIPLVPSDLTPPRPPEGPEGRKSRKLGITTTQFDLSDELDVDVLVDLWITGTLPEPSSPEPAPAPGPKPRPASDWTPNWARREPRHVGRNDPCPCGSGKKYKNCCMRI